MRVAVRVAVRAWEATLGYTNYGYTHLCLRVAAMLEPREVEELAAFVDVRPEAVPSEGWGGVRVRVRVRPIAEPARPCSPNQASRDLPSQPRPAQAAETRSREASLCRSL